MRKTNSTIIDPTKYYENIIFQETDTKKIHANDFINKLIDMAIKSTATRITTKEEQ
ncbi:MAG: hypothetical protein GX984_03110 [Erysipelothrix sp.]|nr:hypothetical protein [Erysipelothrix sp.]